jgi:hypothetical protein
MPACVGAIEAQWRKRCKHVLLPRQFAARPRACFAAAWAPQHARASQQLRLSHCAFFCGVVGSASLTRARCGGGTDTTGTVA